MKTPTKKTTAMLSNRELASKLRELANLMVMAGCEETQAARFARLAYMISRLSEEAEVLCKSGRLAEIPGVGPTTAALLTELLLTGTCRTQRDWERRVPASALELLTIPGVGARTARHLFQNCGVDSLDSLARAVQFGSLRGIDARTATNLRTYFRHYALRQSNQTLSLLFDEEMTAAGKR